MLDKTTAQIMKIEDEVYALYALMELSLEAGDDVSAYAKAISKLETKIWKLETA